MSDDLKIHKITRLDELNLQKSALAGMRLALLEKITSCANEIKKIDKQLAIIKSEELEEDLSKPISENT